MKDIIIYYGFPLLGFLITSFAQMYITSSYSKYKQIQTKSHKRGCDVARNILDKYSLQNITIEEVSGNLTDHYDPAKKVVRLSSDIYNGTSIASVSVAAHECGHAIQDKVGYTPLRIRASLVPIVNLTTKIGYIVIAIGLFAGLLDVTLVGIIMIAAMLLFQLITLPVEFDASHRGKKELSSLGVLDTTEQHGSASMLRAAAFTYVASVLSSLLQILRLIAIFSSNKRRR